MAEVSRHGKVQAMADDIADTRPLPPLVGIDRYFDEPEPVEDERIAGMLEHAYGDEVVHRSNMVVL